MSFQWTDEYATNIPEIDKQHQHLFSLINALQADVLACRTLEEEQRLTARLLTQLVDYAKYHFAEEERLMQAYNFPDREAHQAAHDQYCTWLREFSDSFSQNPAAMSFEAFCFLRDWISNHVLKQDLEYVSYLAGK